MRHDTMKNDRRVGIAGLGSIGKTLVSALQAGIPGMRLGAVAVRDPGKAQDWLASCGASAPTLSLSALADQCDIVVECAPPALFEDIARPVLEAGKQVIVLSVGALLQHPELIELARERGGRILVPTGALLGLDAISAAAEGTIRSVTMVTRKPVAGLLGAPYLVANAIDIADIVEPKLIFSGSARDAIVGFPANVNVAVALSLAGIGPDRTTLEIWADPTVVRNTHVITVDADSASFTVSIQNIPSENPKTGRITALSVVALLRKMTATVSIGT